MRTTNRKIATRFLAAGMITFAACSGTVLAAGSEYECVEQTENQAVIELTEWAAGKYPICPELLQALIFYESSNRKDAVSRWGDVGYMQVNPRWQKDRMDKLGAYDLSNGYENVLIGTDYLMELCEKYEDVGLALMAYNGGDAAAESSCGELNGYAKKILALSEQLERLHGK